MSALNDYFCDYMDTSSFATMLCVALRPQTGECECVCAGHPPGLIVSATGDLRQLRVDSSRPLGIDPAPIQVSMDRIAPGELLALFTDGVSELNNEENQMLGSEGLGAGLCALYPPGAKLPVSELVEQINCCLDSYQGRGIAGDDRTFLLARVV
jgi:serine phosphatase RsbU (regulator of sigma subunit)